MDVLDPDMQSGALSHDESDDGFHGSEMRPGETCDLVEIGSEDHPDPESPISDDLQIFDDDSVQGFFAHTSPVYTVACSPTDANDVITGGGDDRAYRWNLATGEQHPVALPPLKDSVVGVGFCHDGTMFAIASLDGVVCVYSTTDSSLLHTLDGPSSDVEWMTWHPKGNVLAVGCGDGTCWVWRVSRSQHQLLQVLSQSTGQLCGSFAGLGGKWLCSGSEDGTLRVWSVKTGQPATIVEAGPRFHQDPITALDSHPTQPIIVTGSLDQTAKWVHIETGEVLGAVSDHTAAVEAVAFPSPDLQQNWVATSDINGAIFIVDLDRGAIRTRFHHDDGIVRLRWLKRRPHLLCSCALDGSIRIWDSRTGTCLQECRGHTGPVFDLAISADEKFLVSTSEDHTALVFEIHL